MVVGYGDGMGEVMPMFLADYRVTDFMEVRGCAGLRLSYGT